jgi:hypothetical protein
VPTIPDLLSVRSGDPTMIQEIPCSSISLTISHVKGWGYLHDIRVCPRFS